jgi:hypothetical protein
MATFRCKKLPAQAIAMQTAVHAKVRRRGKTVVVLEIVLE